MSFDSTIKCLALSDNLDNPNYRIFDTRHYLSNLDLGHIEYTESHIPGAIFVNLDQDLSDAIIPNVTGRHPMMKPNDFTAKLRQWGLKNTDQVVIYDQGHGGIAARLWWMLKWAGHEHVAVLEGGFNKWNLSEYPVTDQIPSYMESSFQTNFNDQLMVSVDYILDIVNGLTNTKLVDSRAAARFQGDSEPIDPVAGHIPKAINRPFVENLDENGAWKSPETLKRDFDKIIDQENPDQTIFYCGSGVTACHNLITYFKIYNSMARLFPGSWSGYITDRSRPMMTKD